MSDTIESKARSTPNDWKLPNIMRTEGKKAYLIPYPIESFAKPVSIVKEQTYIGRGPDETIQVADRLISRRHACIQLDNQHYYIEDLGSQNGTFLNSEPIQKARLDNHDKITVGQRTFLFLLQPESAPEVHAEVSIEASDTVQLSLEEIDLSDFWAQNADHAAEGFLKPDGRKTPDSHARRRMALERLSLLYKLSESLRAINTIRPIFDKGIDLLLEAIPAAQCVLVARKSKIKDESIQVVACKWRNRLQVDEDTIPVSQTVFDWVLSEKIALVSQNLSRDDRFQDSDSIRMHNLRSIICVPIVGKRNVIGLLYAQSNTLIDPFTKEDAEFSSAVANELALNIDNVNLNNKLIRNERMAAIGLTVSNLAHNIKNLIAVNQGASHLMEIHIKEKNFKEVAKKWRWIQHSFSGISRMTNDMLEYAKEDELHLKPVDINRLILSNRQSFEESLSPNKLTFEFLLSKTNPVWSLDAVQFQRALYNVVLNAVDALAETRDPRIRIRTSVLKKEYLIVSVADNGCGVARDKKSKVFDLFYTTKGTSGTGLGLAMVQKFVEKSGGFIKFHSAEGVGTVVQMVFQKPRGNPVDVDVR